ncbi:DNA translocase FtsK [Candidatus Woesebacteria bacterium]|nr:DNA translocase FtsK [Candidatus Woesebacteria bacterium]
MSIVALGFIGLGILMLISFSGKGDWLNAINTVLKNNFGVALLILPFILMAAGLTMLRLKWKWAQPHVLLGAIVTFIGALGTLESGAIGQAVFSNVSDLLSRAGAMAFYIIMMIAGVLIIAELSLAEIFEAIAAIFHRPLKLEEKPSKEADEKSGGFHLPKLALPFGKSQAKALAVEETSAEYEVSEGTATQEPTYIMPNKQSSESSDGTVEGQPLPAESLAQTQPLIWEYPPLSLLSPNEGGQADRGDVKKNAQMIEDTLKSFNIKAHVADVRFGPSVTQYAISISQGTKLSRVTTLSTDLALALAAPTGQIRIEAPIAGTSLVGIEVPNYSASYVTLRKMLSSPNMKKNPSKLAVALGLDVSGKEIVMDIARMPHVLIAGSTGSGKSVAINAFLCSILFRASPAEVRMILVDPKRVELVPYNDIPHLLVPVITEPKKVVSALKWATKEMEQRYKRLSEVGVKSIAGYNELAGHAAMYSIVIVIDELADVMLFAPAEVEESITRIAQMARAVGIHLVLATQRPSVDVITGLIKANIPARVAFNVSSMMDSRVILDTPGAEKLLGRGDMLYVPPDLAKPQRTQGTYVSDQEVTALVNFIKSQGQKPQYEEEIVTKFKVSAKGGIVESGSEERDDLFDEVVQFVVSVGRASASVIQRKFSLGYNRSARILDQMYAAGMIGPSEGSKAREVYTSKVMEYLRAKEVQSEQI